MEVCHRMLPGLNAAAVGLIVASVFSLSFQIHGASPFPNASVCIGKRSVFYLKNDKLSRPSQGMICGLSLLPLTHHNFAPLKNKVLYGCNF